MSLTKHVANIRIFFDYSKLSRQIFLKGYDIKVISLSISGFPLFVHCTIYIVAMNEQQNYHAFKMTKTQKSGLVKLCDFLLRGDREKHAKKRRDGSTDPLSQTCAQNPE